MEVELINRYIYAVSKNLPEKERKDVEKELRTNIEDMLDGNHDENNIVRILEELGDPNKLADEYMGTKRYLIGPRLYDNYIMVLKLVSGIVVGVVGIISLISIIFDISEAVSLSKFVFSSIFEVFQGVFNGLIGVFVWVTIVFAIIEKTGAAKSKISDSERGWKINDLPEIPVNSSAKISRWEVVFSLFWYILWMGILLLAPNLIGIHVSESGVVPLFNLQELNAYMPTIVILTALGILISVMKLIYGNWNKILALLNTGFNVVYAVVIYFMVEDKFLYNHAFKEMLQNVFNVAPSAFDGRWNQILWSFLVIVIVICILDSTSGIVKSYKAKR